MPLGGKNDRQKKKVAGSLRRTQLVTTFGSGAIADMPDYSVIIAATNYWKTDCVLHEAALERLLNVSGFREPFVSEENEGKFQPDIPAFRFPSMHFCPGCHRLMPYWAFGDETGRKCRECGDKNIVPSRFVAACCNGHLEDFPYRWWVHRGDFSGCAEARNDKLKITFSDRSGGLDSIIITCSACGKSRSMAGCMGKEALKGYHCSGFRPWIGFKSEFNDPLPCSAQMRGLQRGASNVYFSVTESALTIPPWSSAIQMKIDECWEKLKSILDGNPVPAVLETIINYDFSDMISHGYATMEDLKKEIYRRYNSAQGDDYSRQQLREDEYRMFCAEDQDDPAFKTEHTEIPVLLEPFIDDVVLVKRLREVLALRGFRRISPEAPVQGDNRFEGWHQDGDVVPLSAAQLSWLPAIELLGEGIFIRLREDALSQWESSRAGYYYPMQQRLANSNVKCDYFSPRYVLLHTLSHLLIRQLSVECGYSGASIKERIYSTWPGSDLKMSGILLYTSSSDSDGSLGGLVRNGLSVPLEKIFRNMLQEASWCSSDPICIESEAQGLDSLNYAACHACSLLPETSCEMRNCLLDRGSITGALDHRELGFFAPLLEKI